MPSLIVQVADAVVAALNAAEPQLNAQRFYRPVYELTELKTMRVSVVPRSIMIESAGRSVNQHDIAVDVAVQRRCSDDAGLDELMGLVERLADVLRLKRLPNLSDAMWIKTENSPIYSPEHLETKGVFTSVLTVTYRVVR
jgi:hypothetical protein